MTIEQLDDTSIRITVDGQLYPEQVIYKCFYWYAASYSVTIDKLSDGFIIQLSILSGNFSAESFALLKSKIQNDLIDYKTRQIINEETRDIKQILMVKAFSSFDDYDEIPKGELTDPVGFKLD